MKATAGDYPGSGNRSRITRFRIVFAGGVGRAVDCTRARRILSRAIAFAPSAYRPPIIAGVRG